jgi:hypothetical protein
LHDLYPRDASSAINRPPSSWVVVFLLALTAAYWAWDHVWLYHIWREDLIVYLQAMRAFQAGTSPYGDALAPLYFLYPPFFLYLGGLLSYPLPAGWGDEAYTALHVGATLALPLVLARYYFRQLWLSPLFALLLFLASPLFMGVLALCGLNIASTLYCLAIVAGVPGLRRDRWIWFYSAVFVAAMVKIPFLALLLLPILVGRRQLRQWINSALCGVAVVGANLLEARLLPELYSGYKWSLVQGIVHQGYYGFGVFGVVAAYGYKLHLPVPSSAYAVAMTLALAMVGGMLLLRQRLEKAGRIPGSVSGQGSNGIWLALVVVLIIQANPRQLQYDADISLLAAFVLWVYALRIRKAMGLIGLMVALFVPGLLIPLVVKAPHQYGMYGTFETLAAFALVFWRLWREARPEPCPSFADV